MRHERVAGVHPSRGYLGIEDSPLDPWPRKIAVNLVLHPKRLIPPVHQIMGVVEIPDLMARDCEDELAAAYLGPWSRVVPELLLPLEYVGLAVDVPRSLDGVRDGHIKIAERRAGLDSDVYRPPEGVAYLHRGAVYVPPTSDLRMPVQLGLAPQAVAMSAD